MSEQSSPVQYRILPQSPETHIFRVWCTVAEPAEDGQVFRLPAWIPGSYMIRDFARNIISIHARDADGELALEKLDKQRWQAAPCTGALTIVCDVYAWDLSVRAAHLDRSHGFFNGPCVFLEPEGLADQRCSLEILAPLQGTDGDWKVATTLAAQRVDRSGFGLYQAADYDELLDHPVEMGGWTAVKFEAAGVQHELILTGPHRSDAARLRRDLSRICGWQIEFFGQPAPFSRYLFLTMLVGKGYGGLEHRSSTALLCSRDDLPAPGEPEQPGEQYRQFLGLCSHEYFHSWNIKRIRPARFMPFDLARESHTTLLWVFEGFTSYYDDLVLLRAGVINREAYLELLGQTITRVLRTPGRLLQSAAESSFDAWTRFYKQDENAPNAIISYYAKGTLIALCLDLHLRGKTAGECSLDNVMRYLWAEYGQQERGLAEDEMAAAIRAATGVDVAEELAQWVFSPGDLPLEPLLKAHGVEVKLRCASGAADRGGKPPAGDIPPVWFGARLVAEGGMARVQVVVKDSPAARSGLAAGDLLVAMDGLRVSADGLDRQLMRHEPGQCVRLHVLRHDALLELDMSFDPAPQDTVWLEVTDENRAVEWLQP